MEFPPELDNTDSSDSELDTDSSSSGYMTPNESDSEELLLAGDLLASHLESAWNECFDCSDVILKPGQPDDQTSQDSVSLLEIRCHKFVLAARSKVFRAMFQQNKNESTFELPDRFFAIFERFLIRNTFALSDSDSKIAKKFLKG